MNIIKVTFADYIKRGEYGVCSGSFAIWCGKIKEGVNVPRAFKPDLFVCHPADKDEFLAQFKKWGALQP